MSYSEIIYELRLKSTNICFFLTIQPSHEVLNSIKISSGFRPLGLEISKTNLHEDGDKDGLFIVNIEDNSRAKASGLQV